MPLSDNNPERRNLTILSLAIIVFYLADGYFINNEIKFKIVNIGFHNREVLGYLVWVILTWFLFKYWLTSKGAAGELLRHEQPFLIKMKFKYLKKYIKEKSESGKLNEDETGVKVYSSGSNGWVIVGYGNSARLLGIKGKIIILYYLIKTAPLHRITTDFFMPYLLWLAAVTLGIVNICS